MSPKPKKINWKKQMAETVARLSDAVPQAPEPVLRPVAKKIKDKERLRWLFESGYLQAVFNVSSRRDLDAAIRATRARRKP